MKRARCGAGGLAPGSTWRCHACAVHPRPDLQRISFDRPAGRGWVVEEARYGAATRTLPDANDNMIALTPPARPAHEFDYTPVNLESSYAPPNVGLADDVTRQYYDLDRMLTRVDRPDGTLQYGYDAAGRLAAVTAPTHTVTYGYDGTCQQNRDTYAAGICEHRDHVIPMAGSSKAKRAGRNNGHGRMRA